MGTIERLEALDKAATAGPWRWSDEFKTRDNDETWSLLGGGGYGILSCDGCGNSPQMCNKHDAELIVEMRESFSALLAVAKAAHTYCVLSHAGADAHDAYLELWGALDKLEATP